MGNAILLIVKIATLFLRNVKDSDDCPDGLCEQPLAMADELTVQLKKPSLSFGFFDTIKFLRCVPMDRVYAVGKRILGVFQNCDRCPDGECGLFDILKCINIKEAVAIVEEVLAIIRDSRICDGGGENEEITLGQATA